MVAMGRIEDLSRRIVEEFDPDKIILFGSHAYGTPKEYSDVDLLIIMPFEGHPFDKATEILERIDHGFLAEVIVQSPEDAERRYREFDPLIREAFDRGRSLDERVEHDRPRGAGRKGRRYGR